MKNRILVDNYVQSVNTKIDASTGSIKVLLTLDNGLEFPLRYVVMEDLNKLIAPFLEEPDGKVLKVRSELIIEDVEEED